MAVVQEHLAAVRRRTLEVRKGKGVSEHFPRIAPLRSQTSRSGFRLITLI